MKKNKEQRVQTEKGIHENKLTRKDNQQSSEICFQAFNNLKSDGCRELTRKKML
jgi:hypothetical protein